jgi:capsular exopolysaccharide synthesis family protein
MSVALQEATAVEQHAAQTPDAESPGFFRILWNHRYLFLLGLVAGLGVGVLIYLRQPVSFQSTARLIVDKKQPGAAIAPGLETRQAFFEESIGLHERIIKSPEIVKRAVAMPGIKDLQTLAGHADPVNAVIAGLTITGDSRASGTMTLTLDVAYRGPVAEDCDKILNAVIKSYEEFLKERYHAPTNELKNLVEKSMGALTQGKTAAEKEYEEFQRTSPIFLHGKNGALVQREAVARIETELTTYRLRRIELETRLKRIEAARARGEDLSLYVDLPLEPARPNVSGVNTTGTSLQDKLLPLLAEERRLLQYLGESHPEVQAIRGRIELTRMMHEGTPLPLRLSWWQPTSEATNAKKWTEFQIQRMERLLDEVKEKETAATELLNKEREGLRALDEFEKREKALRERIDDSKQLYSTLERRLREINFVKDYSGYDPKVISPPGFGARVPPRLFTIFGGALFCGLVGGVALAWLAEVTDRSFRNPEEIRRRLRLPVLGHVPFLRSDADFRRRAERLGGPSDPILHTYYRPKSPEAESFRGIRTALFFSTVGAGRKVLQITSPDMGDGKTTIAANLAVSIAQSGKTVILVDADFRRPRLHKIFKTANEAGLATILAGDHDLDPTVQPSGVPNLSILPCGQRPANPAELLTSSGLKEVLDELGARYDFVIIDSPPLLVVSDPSVLATQVDGILLTIRVSKNSRPHAERAREILAGLGANVLGVVVSRGAGGSDGSRYSYRYGYDYGYGYGYGYGYSGGYYTDESSTEMPLLPSPVKSPPNGPATPPRNGHPHGE